MPREFGPPRRRRRVVLLPRVYDLIARGLIALVFVGSGVRRLTDAGGPVEALAGAGLPAPEALNAVTAVLDIVGGTCLLLGFRVWLVAMAMALYVVPFAFVLHALPGKENAMHGLLFARELAVAGGLILLAGVHREDPRRPVLGEAPHVTDDRAELEADGVHLPGRTDPAGRSAVRAARGQCR